MLSDEDIYQRYLTKQSEFEKTADVTLIGHSLFDMWSDIEPTITLKGQTVANLGLSGTSTRQYLDVIAKPHRLSKIGKTVFYFLGVNDIVKEPDYSPQQVIDWLVEIDQEVRAVAKSDYRAFLLQATPVNNITTTNNAEIQAMNAYLEAHCPANFTFVPTYDQFLDKEGNLDLALCRDGLHFNADGYKIVRRILESYI